MEDRLKARAQAFVDHLSDLLSNISDDIEPF